MQMVNAFVKIQHKRHTQFLTSAPNLERGHLTPWPGLLKPRTDTNGNRMGWM